MGCQVVNRHVYFFSVRVKEGDGQHHQCGIYVCEKKVINDVGMTEFIKWISTTEDVYVDVFSYHGYEWEQTPYLPPVQCVLSEG